MADLLNVLFKEFWMWRTKEWPEFASYCGDHRYDDRLDDLSEAAFLQRKVVVQGFVDRCQNIQEDNLSATDKVSLQLLKEELETFLKGIETKAYVFPLSNMEGIHVDFELVTSWMKFDTEEGYRYYLSRLQHLPQRIDQDIANFQQGINIGKTFSKYCVENVPAQVESLMTSVEETCFYQPFTSCENDLKPKIKDIQEKAKDVIENDIFPALKKLKTFMEEVYLPSCRTSPGVCGMSGGKEFYEHVLGWHISLSMTPQEVHDLGVTEVARIKAEMHEVLEKVGFKGDLKAFFEELKTNDKFYFTSKEEVLAAYRDLASNVIRPTLSKLFHKIPKSPLIIVPVSEAKSSGPAAYYLAGTLDGSRPGKFYINTSNLRDNGKFDMMTLSLHEGEPGHHFQGMHAIEAQDLPTYRRYIEDMYYSFAPCRFGIHGGYGEGWGLYCEFLGKELGLYEDPYSLFGHLSFEMFRACRLIADTGLHYFNWTFDQAVDLFLENTCLTKEAIVTECKRYCTIPGQACAYKVGQIKIQELRKKTSEQLGDKFDVRDFHEEVLRVGMVPLSILEDVINSYIEKTLAK